MFHRTTSAHRQSCTRKSRRGLRFEPLEARRVLNAAWADALVGEGEVTAESRPDFELADVNPNSSSHEQAVSPRDYLEQTSAWYFSHSTWGYCRSQFGYLDDMQQDLQEAYPMLAIQILSVNAVGHEFGNDGMVEGRSLPLLQDVDQDNNGQSDVTDDAWDAEWRDVVVLNADNEQTAVYNLSNNDLALEDRYQHLRQLILETAIRDQRPWTNPDNHLDVTGDGLMTAFDAHQLVQTLLDPGPRQLPELTDGEEPPRFYDTNLDGFVAPLDALRVINFLIRNNPSQVGEGEAVAEVSLPQAKPGAMFDATLELGSSSHFVPLTSADPAKGLASPTQAGESPIDPPGEQSMAEQNGYRRSVEAKSEEATDPPLLPLDPVAVDLLFGL